MTKSNKTKIYHKFSKGKKITIVNDDCFSFIRSIPDSYVDLTVTSPPYCMGKEYESSRNYQDFLEFHARLFPEIMRITKNGGSICWQVGFHVNKNEVMPLDFLVLKVLENYKEIKLRNRIAWTFGHGLHCERRFSGRHETLLWFTKGDDYLFDLDAVRVKQKYPGKTFYKGEKKGLPSGNPKGKNPGDVWDIPNVKANHIEKTKHPCQFPVSLAQRVIRACTNVGGVVFDPFMGSGTVAVASVLNKRKFVGSEIDTEYYRIAMDRIRAAVAGKAKVRPDTPVCEPDLNSKVARDPFGT